MNYYWVSFLVIFFLLSCGEEVTVKPQGMLHLHYPEPMYRPIDLNCPFTFVINNHASLEKKQNCWVNIVYPKMKATLHITYREVNNNLDSLLYDAQKLTYDHTIKASVIDDLAYEDSIKKVYGMYYEIGGNAATSSQFFVTDTTNHFITGSLYFNAKPNYDSILPAISYVRADIRRLMESIQWKKND